MLSEIESGERRHSIAGLLTMRATQIDIKEERRSINLHLIQLSGQDGLIVFAHTSQT